MLQMWKTRLKPEELAYVEFCERYQNTYDQTMIKRLIELLNDEEKRSFGPSTDLSKSQPFTIKIGG